MIIRIVGIQTQLRNLKTIKASKMIKISSAIFKTFFLSLCIVANTHFAFGQTASILPPGYTQYLDSNGKPLSAGKVYNYVPNTTTLKTTWQDAAETIPNANPVILDAGGRAKILGDGSYRQIVKDRNNNTIWDAVTSSTGSGSSSPTATGDGDLVGTIKPWAGMTAPNQYAFAYGQEVSRTTYSSLYTAITSTQAAFCTSGSPTLTGLADTTNFWIGMSVEATCLAAGFSTIISKTSSSVTLAANANVSVNINAVFYPWGRGNGTTTFNLPDLRGVVLAGNNNMGGVASSNLTTTYFGSTNPNSIGALGGSQFNTLTAVNIPGHNHAVFLNDPGHNHTTDAKTLPGGAVIQAGAGVGAGSAVVNSNTTGITIRDTSSGFGTADQTNYTGGGIAVSATLGNTGSGYTNGSQTITVTGGTCTTQPQFTVTVAGNIFTGTPALLTAGSCTVAPANPAATSGGGGTGGTLNVTYSSQPFGIIPPSKTTNYIIKITPDVNSATASGVTSLGGMTGSIACGASLTCTGNTISVSSIIVNTDSVFYTAPYTGGVIQSQTTYNSKRISVTDFNAVGNNIADDTAAIQSAITAAQTAGGKEVYFPAPSSCYKITSTLNITAQVSLKGEGGLASKICAVNTNAITLNFVTGFGNVTIDGLYIVGSGATATRYGIIVPGTTNSSDVIYGITIKNNLISTFPVGISLKTVRKVSIDSNWTQNVDKGIELNGVAYNVNINESRFIKASGGGGFATLNGIELNNVVYAVGGSLSPEAVTIASNSKFYGFDTCALLNNANYVSIDQTDFGACVNVGIQFQTIQNGLQITNSYIEIAGATAAQGIYGVGLGAQISTQVNIADNSIIGTGTVSANGIQINGAANTNQYNVNIVRNYFSGMTNNDIRANNPGPMSINNNRCNSSGVPTNSISIGTRQAGTIIVKDNVCIKDIVAVTATDLTNGFIRFENNTVNATTAQASNWNITTDNTTANRLMLGGGSGAQPSAAPAGTTTTVWHGNAAGAGSYGSVVSADLNITTTSCTDQFVSAISAGGVGTCSTVNMSQLSGTLGANQGGTGVANNAASTITISGAFGTTLTVTGTTSITLPTTGTLATLAGTEELTNKTLTSSVGKGTWTADGTTPWTFNYGSAAQGLWIHSATGSWSPTTTEQTQPFGATAGLGMLISGNTPDSSPTYTAVGYGVSGGGFRGGASGGSLATPTASTAGLLLSYMGGHGYNGSGWTAGTKALLAFTATSLWSGSNNETHVTIETVPNGSINRGLSARFHGSSGVSINTTTDPGAGALLTNTFMQATTYVSVGTKIRAAGAAPTITAGCNGAGSSISGSDLAGTVTGQTAAATTCTITFNSAYSSTPYCTATGLTSPLTGAVTPSTTTLVVNFASTANYQFNYQCIARSAG